MALEKAKIWNVSVDPEESIDVLFNPTEYTIDKGANYAELNIPGLRTPILQFIRGEQQKLDLELFLDGTNKRTPIEEDLEKLRRFVRIDSELHAPPVCRFEWGRVNFQGVMATFKENYTLFSEDGQVLRAKVTVSIKSYESAEVQQRELRRSSPDRTRVRVLREGERLDLLALEAYGDSRLWRHIAKANQIEQPRFVPVGTPLVIPAI